MEQIAIDNGLLHISYTNVATVLVDISALFFLLGMIPCTHIYRKRNRLSDRLFFAMILTDIVMAVSDAAVDILSESSFLWAPGVVVFSGSVMNISFAFMSLFLMHYLLCFLPEGDEIVVKWFKPSLIPAAVTVLFVIINAFTGIMFYVEKGTGAYLHGPLYYIMAVPFILYALVGLFVLWKINRLGILLFVILVVTRLILEVLFTGVSSTAFVFAVVLVYAMVGAMNRSFHMGGQ